MARATPGKPAIPDKLYFKIGEVAKLVGVAPYVLRYWESEFPSLRPGKTRSKHRLYRRRDVETLREIKRLLHDERFTIEGARRRLKGAKHDAQPGRRQPPLPSQTDRQAQSEATRYRSVLGRVKRDLEALRKMLG